MNNYCPIGLVVCDALAYTLLLQALVPRYTLSLIYDT